MRRARRVAAAAALTFFTAACTTQAASTSPTPTAHRSTADRSGAGRTPTAAVSHSADPTAVSHGADPAAVSHGADPSPDGQPPSSAEGPASGDDRSPTGNPVTIAFGGDVHFEGASRSALGGFGPIATVLGRADIAMVNLETAVTDRGTPQPKAYNFRAPSSAFRALRSAGVDVVTMANNHGMDYGVAGLRDSLSAAAAAHFPVVGIGADDAAAFAPYRVIVNGQRIAVIGATQVLDTAFVDSWAAGPGKPGLASAKQEARLLAAVASARANADTVVVYLHWGQERATCPIAAQRDLAPKLVDAGADIVVGSHAHVLLGGGWTGDGAYVDYGLGNFVFYARGGAGAQSGVLQLTVRGRAVTAATFTPAVISGGRPQPLTGAAAANAVASWDRLRSCAGLAGLPPGSDR